MFEGIYDFFNLEKDKNLVFDFENYCFVCGKEMFEKSKEDLIPKWLLRDQNLHNERIILPHETRLKFKSLLFPCCKKCNNNELSRLENQIKKILAKDTEAISKNEKETLFKWGMKIYLGFFLKSKYLKEDIKLINSEPIVKDKQISARTSILGLIKSIKYNIQFENFKPYSIFIYDFKKSAQKAQFNILVDLVNYTISIRFGKIAFVLVLNDNGVIENFSEVIKVGSKHEIDEIKLIEIHSRIAYTSSLLERNKFNYLTYEIEETKSLIYSSLLSSKSINLNQKWNPNKYFQLLEANCNKVGLLINLNRETGNLFIHRPKP